MGCVLLVIALTAPRVTAVLLWLLTSWFTRAFQDKHELIPLLGFIFLPYTLLWYSVVVNWYGGVWGLWQSLFLVTALIADFSTAGGGHRYRRRTRRIIVDE